MKAPATGEISKLLRAWQRGEEGALERLTPLVYGELKRLARRYMRRERAGHTLQTTALVNEAYLRFASAQELELRDRAHFFALSARMMRRILVNAARDRKAAKRWGGVERENHSTAVNFDEIADTRQDRGAALLALDEALDELGAIDPRKAQVIELRYFAGMNVEETAQALAVSPQTVMRDWKLAKAWLNRRLSGGA